MGSSHIALGGHAHLGYEEYTSELLPELSSGTTMSSGHLSTGERLSESNDSAKVSATMSWMDQTLHRPSHLISFVLHHFAPSHP